MLKYKEAQKIFATAKDPEKGKPLQNNTRLFKRGEDFAVRLHETDVVTIHPDGTYTLNTGGWETVTTKDRINAYAPGHVCSDRGILYYVSKTRKEAVLFKDGMKVRANGALIGRRNAAAEKAWEKKRGLMRKAVTDYIGGFLAHFSGKGLPIKDGRFSFAGDCFYCCMRPTDGSQLPLGHILSHIDEGYYVPSLLAQAVEKRGYSNPGTILSMIHYDLEAGRESYLAKTSLEYYFRPLINKLTEQAEPEGYGRIFVRQQQRERQKRRRKVKA